MDALSQANSRLLVALVTLALFVLAACSVCGLGGLLQRMVIG